MKKLLKKLIWVIISITPLFLYMEHAMGINLSDFSGLKIIGFGAFIGLTVSIQECFVK